MNVWKTFFRHTLLIVLTKVNIAVFINTAAVLTFDLL